MYTVLQSIIQSVHKAFNFPKMAGKREREWTIFGPGITLEVTPVRVIEEAGQSAVLPTEMSWSLTSQSQMVNCAVREKMEKDGKRNKQESDL